jgi:catechol 2,3-dioxygenase-like lactoylglutathione lyase family enzyme
VLPRFRQLSDPEILAAPFKLADAQELVARQQGFESWQALKQGLRSMSDLSAQTSTRPVITAVAAELFVSDIQRSCDFFTRKLGFTIVYVYGEPPFYGQVKRDAARFNLKHMDRPVIDPQLRDSEQLLSADMCVDTADEIKQLYLEFQRAGVEFQQTLMRQPWGARNFVVKDPDGNLLLFAGPAE